MRAARGRSRAARAIALAGLALPASAAAQTFAVSAIAGSTPNFGNIAAAASGTTYFTISPSGAITTSGAAGGNIASGTKSAATVTITCTGSTNQCSNGTAIVLVKATTTSTGRALPITAFSAQTGSGTVGTITTNPDGSITFPFTGLSALSGKTFFVGLTMPIQGDSTTTVTTATATWGVGVAKSPTIPTTTSRTTTATATVRKALSISKTSDLAFGAVRAPDSGSGTVTVDPSTGQRSGTLVLIPGLSSTAAAYTATGQASTAITISVPPSAPMTSAGGGTLTATLNSSKSGAQTLSSGGTISWGVGGTVTIPSGTAAGSYSGPFTVTVSYN